jgi:hypothetical protein
MHVLEVLASDQDSRNELDSPHWHGKIRVAQLGVETTGREHLNIGVAACFEFYGAASDSPSGWGNMNVRRIEIDSSGTHSVCGHRVAFVDCSLHVVSYQVLIPDVISHQVQRGFRRFIDPAF